MTNITNTPKFELSETITEPLDYQFPDNLYIGRKETAELGSYQKYTIAGTPTQKFDSYQVVLPKIFKEVLKKLSQEYDECLKEFVTANREWLEDYQFCFDEKGTPINWGMQIDMAALPMDFLEKGKRGKISEEKIRQVLLARTFEFENSLAMYALTGFISPEFKLAFKQMLDNLRQKFNRRIVLLAVTKEKYQAILESEFGVSEKSKLSQESIKTIGFDEVWGPEEFEEYSKINLETREKYLFYARTSEATSSFRGEQNLDSQKLLDNQEFRKTIKEGTITLSINNPNLPTEKQIRDTKVPAAENLGLGVLVSSMEEIYDPVYLACKENLKKYKITQANGRNNLPDDSIQKYLHSIGIDIKTVQGKNANNIPEYEGRILGQKLLDYLTNYRIFPKDIETGCARLRAKPALGVYGAYGQMTFDPKNKKDRSSLKRLIERSVSPYIIQIEISPTTVQDKSTNKKYLAMDRMYVLPIISEGGEIDYTITGERYLFPENSPEALKNNLHGSIQSINTSIK